MISLTQNQTANIHVSPQINNLTNNLSNNSVNTIDHCSTIDLLNFQFLDSAHDDTASLTNESFLRLRETEPTWPTDYYADNQRPEPANFQTVKTNR